MTSAHQVEGTALSRCPLISSDRIIPEPAGRRAGNQSLRRPGRGPRRCHRRRRAGRLAAPATPRCKAPAASAPGRCPSYVSTSPVAPGSIAGWPRDSTMDRSPRPRRSTDGSGIAATRTGPSVSGRVLSSCHPSFSRRAGCQPGRKPRSRRCRPSSRIRCWISTSTRLPGPAARGQRPREARFDVAAALVTQGIRLADLTPQALLHYAWNPGGYMPPVSGRETNRRCRDTPRGTSWWASGISRPARRPG